MNQYQSFVTADILAHQVLLNRVPEQATEDSVRFQIYNKLQSGNYNIYTM